MLICFQQCLKMVLGGKETPDARHQLSKNHKSKNQHMDVDDDVPDDEKEPKDIRVLGTGVYSKVSLALWGTHLIAIKRTIRGGANEPTFSRDVLADIQSLTQLHRHPHIMKLLKVSLPNPSCVELYLPYYPTSLHQELVKRRIKRETLSFYEIQRGMYQLVSAVAYAHDHRRLHRDIKPPNILLDERGNFILGDWGLSACFGEDVGLEVISPSYRPLELFLSPKLAYYRGEVDVWSLGCTFHDILSGSIPFDFDDYIWTRKFKSRDSYFIHNIIQSLGMPSDHESVYTTNHTRRLETVIKSYLQSARVAIPPSKRSHTANIYRSLLGDAGADLIFRMLHFDPRARITAREALDHPFFHASTGVEGGVRMEEQGEETSSSSSSSTSSLLSSETMSGSDARDDTSSGDAKMWKKSSSEHSES